MVSSFFYLLVAFIPVLLYIFVIWATSPWKSISLGTAFQYLFTGLVSIGIILTVFRIFPSCQSPVFGYSPSLSLFFLCYIQIAMLEELCKLTAFSIGDRIRKDERHYDSAIGTMFYCGISALGFAFLENVSYAMQYGGDVIIFRSVVSMMVHFLCGLIMGYWISASRLPFKLENRSMFEVMCGRRPLFKKASYYTIGIFCAVSLHGLYDFNIFIRGSESVSYIIIFGGIISAYLAAKSLIERSKF